MGEVHTIVTVQSKGYIIGKTPPSSFKKVESSFSSYQTLFRRNSPRKMPRYVVKRVLCCYVYINSAVMYT